MTSQRLIQALLLAFGATGIQACGSSADDLGVGAQCTAIDQCDTKLQEVCVTQFKIHVDRDSIDSFVRGP